VSWDPEKFWEKPKKSRNRTKTEEIIKDENVLNVNENVMKP